MKKTVKFTGKGEIEFYLPSVKHSITLKAGGSKDIDNLSEKDVKTIKALRKLGLEIVQKKTAKKAEAPDTESKDVNENMDVEQSQVEVLGSSDQNLEEKTEGVEDTESIVDPDKTEDEKEEEKEKYTTKNLMAKTAAELKKLAKELGVEFPDGASKSEITELILAKGE